MFSGVSALAGLSPCELKSLGGDSSSIKSGVGIKSPFSPCGFSLSISAGFEVSSITVDVFSSLLVLFGWFSLICFSASSGLTPCFIRSLNSSKAACP